jgi:spermidine/putrescine transport system substrate-binding protein
MTRHPVVSAASAPPEGVINRRLFLSASGAGALAIAGGSLLAACGSATGGSSSSSKVGGPLNMFTWAGYEGATVLKTWYKQHDIQLHYKSITNQDPAAVIKGPGGSEWDSSSVNQGSAQAYYNNLHISTKITVQEVPNLAGLLPFFKNSEFFRISDGVYNCVPWTWGPIGLSYRDDRVTADELNSWQNLLLPKWKGRLGTFDDGNNMAWTAAVALGLDLTKITRAQAFGPIKGWLKKLMPNLKVLSTSLGDQVNTLIAGDVDVQLVGLTYFSLQASQQHVKLGFTTPSVEGSYGFCDCVFIPPDSKHRANALAYANAILGGPTAIAMQNSLAQLSTNASVNPHLDASVLKFFPTNLSTYTSKTLKWNKNYSDPNGPYATTTDLQTMWEQVKAGS